MAGNNGLQAMGVLAAPGPEPLLTAGELPF